MHHNAAALETSVVRRRLHVAGRVQGVGFRPYVYRLAAELNLTGRVSNDSDGVTVEVQGDPTAVESFLHRLPRELPPLAHISGLRSEIIEPQDEHAFTIGPSTRGDAQHAEVTPDVAVCPDCLRELFDPRDRRFGYPFINCTNCGPRYSIVSSIPYDRPNTTMRHFRMCPQCQAEYDDPTNRRFHAQPNACPVCGPHVWFTDDQGNPQDGPAIETCIRWLAAGRIVAIKGIGGFHLACRAMDEAAVQRLRHRKGREAKPLAVMVASLDEARRLAHIDESAARALISPEHPIVLVPRRRPEVLARSVAPGTDCLGLMLPYTPLHHLLLAGRLGPLVMTSGNASDEPLCCDNTDALRRLEHIADGFLFHNRDIERRVDDSVVIAGKRYVTPVRRARGFAPGPITIAKDSPCSILALGGDLKTTVCFLDGRQAVVSEHLGDLANARACRNYLATIDKLRSFLRVQPKVIAHDLHPGYVSSQSRHRFELPAIGVQHHHAHIVSCMAEHGLEGPVIGIACDGTGYGTDGAIWGCEVLACDEANFARRAHLAYFPLLGGDAAAHETWRPAAGLLATCLGDGWIEHLHGLDGPEPEKLAIAERRLSSPHTLPKTSSLGRLFDAVAFLLGVCGQNRFEAQAAMALEALAASVEPVAPLPFEIRPMNDVPAEIHVTELIRELLRRRAAGESTARLARAFHASVAQFLTDAVLQVARETELDRVVLSGGCFLNRLLLAGVTERLEAAGLQVFTHHIVPPGDGGISLGQAVSAAARLRRE